MRAERCGDLACRGELIRRERVDEEFADGAQMRDRGTPECLGAGRW